jgi:hypothetical protein
MGFSRRQFITAGAAAATAGCIPVRPLGFLVGTAGASMPIVGESSRSLFASSANFRPHIGTFFTVLTPHRPSVVTLTHVDDFRLPGTVAARRLKTPGAGFTLLFDGSQSGSFPQGTYSVRHPKIGTFDLFLAPVGRGTDVQAVINRLH